MKNIPYGHQFIDEEDIQEVVKVLRSDWLTQGPKGKELEKALCDYTGAKYAVVVSSGTAALHLACLAVGLKQSDEAITTPITFVATPNSVLYSGARPVFADVDSETANIDPDQIRNKISPSTKAVLPVHFAGLSCDMPTIKKIAKKNGLKIIEDACHALGAEYKSNGRWVKVGSCAHSDITVFSFHPVKSITTGEGGAITTNSKEYYEKLTMLRQHGITKDPSKFTNQEELTSKFEIRNSKFEKAWYHEMQMLGFNYRITDFQSALGISQLKKLDKFIKRRREIAGIYNQAFKENEYFDLPIEKDYAKSSWHLYPIRLKDEYKDKKALIFNKLRENGLGVQVHYIPVYLQSYYENLGYNKGFCPNAEDFYQKEISLPIYPAMSNDDLEQVQERVYKIFKEIQK
jgi:UDP-4-amino-4,6-dideoxy-N-acetyl-beta-L-altrosamine transaminase